MIVKMMLDRESIGRAIDKLEKYAHGKGQGSLDAIIEKKIQVAVNAAVRRATHAFNTYVPPKALGIKDTYSAIDAGQVTVTGYRLNSTTWIIEASGRTVGFMEFGTGHWTTEEDIIKNDVPYDVWPGSWSEQHKNTYKEWMDSGVDPNKYPWNSKPTRAMEKALDSARKALKRMTGGGGT